MDDTPSPLFPAWQDSDTRQWGHAELKLAHRWHEHPLFSREALAGLIERYPAEHYALVRTSLQGEAARQWREGDIGDFNGQEVIEAIAQGRMWLNLRNVHLVDARYARLLDAAYAELAERVPGFEPSALRMGILISSPGIHVHYHADLPGQALWQVAGRKRVYLYPARPPFLPPAALEDIALTGVEVKMPYDPAFDQQARVFELAPGAMLHWPLNAPHRVENHDCLNVSVTTEHWTPGIRRSQMVTMANGILRRHLKLHPSGRELQGPGFWMKAALQAAWRRSPWSRRVQRLQRPIDFRLDRTAAGLMRDIPPFYR
ncbi:hypothetical protein V4F39_07565 [Aquincola sp. MAHUQ-54]|uniref:JmjC domain-containing protein n=1 Tax=Aquincola agrisoli TaxID=3119538 RepID=A0AAW9Q1P9_9BURK